MESFELQRVARRIQEKESCLFSRQTFKPDSWFDDEINFSFSESRRQFLPFVHGKNRAEMAHRHLIAIDIIMCFVSGLVRA